MAELAEPTDRPRNDAEPHSDGALLKQCRVGDEAAASELYAKYAHRLRALAELRCADSLARCLDADDIVQSVFRSFFRAVRQGYYDVPEGEDLWKLLLVIAVNKIRAQGAHHHAAKRDARLTSSLDPADPASQRKLSRDEFSPVFLKLALEDALEQLDPRQRRMVELRMEGHEVAEIADKTGRSKRTVERNLQEVRNKLRDLLAREA
jgi:RNA polymerase sigma-70 factor (ECF subfamily)